MKSLFLITARGGSKGIPHKNIKPLAGKPLIYYAIDIARQFVEDSDICLSTDDDAIIKTAEDYGLKICFKRPDYLASDTAGSYEVILHAVHFFEQQGVHYDNVVLLQPTSPFIKGKKQNELSDEHIKKIIDTYVNRVDVEKYAHVATIDEIKANDYNLNIPRYVNTADEEEEIDLANVANEIKSIDREIADTEAKLKKSFDELGIKPPF